MSAIFRSAQQVIIWLGEGTEPSQRLVQYLGEDSPGQIPTSQDIIDLFSHRWWHRVWVLQEIAAAKRATVVCGAMSCSWEDFMSNAKTFRNIRAGGNNIPYPAVFSFGLRCLVESHVHPPGNHNEHSLQTPKVRKIHY